MIRYAKYEVGDRVCAETFHAYRNGNWIFIHGTVVRDEGERELVIKPDKGSFCGDVEEFTVYKDRLK